jgi:hypothetical protein
MQSEPVWTTDPKTAATEWCRPTSHAMLRVSPKGRRFEWKYHRDYFGLQQRGLADTREQARADAISCAMRAHEQILRQIEQDVHPTELVSFACKKLGVSEEALREEYIVHREKDRRESQKKLLALMMKDRPDVVLKMLETARDKGFISQETIDQGKALGLFGPPPSGSSA